MFSRLKAGNPSRRDGDQHGPVARCTCGPVAVCGGQSVILWPVRLLRSFVIALLIGAIVSAWVIAAAHDLTVLAVSLFALGVVMAALTLFRRDRLGDADGSPARKLPGVSTAEGIVRYGTHIEDGEDPDLERSPFPTVSQAAEKREIPYALQIANVVVGLAIVIAGVIVAVVKS